MDLSLLFIIWKHSESEAEIIVNIYETDQVKDKSDHIFDRDIFHVLKAIIILRRL